MKNPILSPSHIVVEGNLQDMKDTLCVGDWSFCNVQDLEPDLTKTLKGLPYLEICGECYWIFFCREGKLYGETPNNILQGNCDLRRIEDLHEFEIVGLGATEVLAIYSHIYDMDK